MTQDNDHSLRSSIGDQMKSVYKNQPNNLQINGMTNSRRILPITTVRSFEIQISDAHDYFSLTSSDGP